MRPRTYVFLIGLAVSVAVFLYSRTRNGAAVFAQATDAVASAAYTVGDAVGFSNRGLRDNNPGNVERTTDQWVGLLSQAEVEANGGTWDARFCQFDTIGHGVRAFGHVITTYANSYGIDTIRGIVSRYAPPNENDTEQYIAEVASDLGVEDRDSFDVITSLPDLAASMMRKETGFTADRDSIAAWVYS